MTAPDAPLTDAEIDRHRRFAVQLRSVGVADTANIPLDEYERLVADHLRLAAELRRAREALRKLILMARTTGGVAGRDDALCKALDDAEAIFGGGDSILAERGHDDRK